MSELLDAALAYAARGWPVFPCQPGRKEPNTARGVLDATTDPAEIRAWWAEHPGDNIGIATGHPGPDVIDVDIKNGNGYEAYTALAAAGLAASTSFVQTPSGGLHAYYAGTSQRNGRIPGRSLDFRGAGGYVLAPPSAIAGTPYRAAGIINPAGPADWAAVRALLDPPPDPPAFTQPGRPAPQQQAGRPGDDWAAATTWAHILTSRGWTRTRDLGSGRAMWRRPGKNDGSSATTRDDGGLFVFSTSTEFDPEVPYTKFGAYAVLEHGGDHAAAARQLRADGYGDPLPQPPALQLAAAAAQDGEDNWWSAIATRHVTVDWEKLWDDTPEQEQWLVEPILAAGRSIAIYSAPKVGKSLLALEVAAALATGRPVLAQAAGEPRRVLYVDLENSRRDLKDRLTDLGYKPADLGSLIYLSFPSLPALDSAAGGREMLALALEYKVALVVIDTVSRVISGSENDADTFSALYRHALAPLKGLEIAVLRLDHAGKDLGKGQRGTSAKNADVDAVWTLSAAGPVITLRNEMSRTQIENPRLTLRRQSDPLRHELAGHDGPPDRVRQLMAKLDELKVPRTAGRPTCLRALNGAAFPIGNTDHLTRAVATRKMQPDLTAPVSFPVSPDLTGDLQSASEELADQAMTGTQQSAEVSSFPGVPDATDWRDRRPKGSRAQSGGGARACSTCGELLPHTGTPCTGTAP